MTVFPLFFLSIPALFGLAVDNFISLPPLQLASTMEAFLAGEIQAGPVSDL